MDGAWVRSGRVLQVQTSSLKWSGKVTSSSKSVSAEGTNCARAINASIFSCRLFKLVRSEGDRMYEARHTLAKAA